MKQDSTRYHRRQRYLTEKNISKGVQINWKLVESQKVLTNYFDIIYIASTERIRKTVTSSKK